MGSSGCSKVLHMCNVEAQESTCNVNIEHRGVSSLLVNFNKLPWKTYTGILKLKAWGKSIGMLWCYWIMGWSS